MTLLYFIRKRRDLPFNWMFLLFGLFIVECGTKHWMEVWTLWEPQYWLAGVIKAITAAASVPTAIALALLIPQALAMLLQIIGHEARQARDAVAALAVAASFRPHVGIFDIGLPDIDGNELARRVRRETWGKNMRLIALTGWGRDEDKNQSLQAGFDRHLTKPVDLKVLEDELRDVAVNDAA